MMSKEELDALERALAFLRDREDFSQSDVDLLNDYLWGLYSTGSVPK
jgi:hypothetical protein